MACLKVPVIPLPEFPTGFSFSPPSLGPISGDLTLCCKLVALEIPIPPIPIPPVTVNVAFLVAVNQAIQAAQAFMDALELDCPRN